MITTAIALSYEGMADLLRYRQELLSGNAFISIVPDELRKRANDIKWPPDSDRWLSMFFDDIRPEHLPLLPELEENYGRHFVSFGNDHADAIIGFLRTCQKRPEPETLYVNCVAGVSRSGAIASFACEAFNMDRKKFMRENPQIMPNNIVLYLLRERWQLTAVQM